MPLETVVCDLCGCAQTHPLLTVEDRIYGLPGKFKLVRCDECGLVFLNPRPDRASIGLYYPDLDYHAFQKPAAWKEALLARRNTREAERLLADRGSGSTTVLEIGCGTGDLLGALHAGGASVTGIEPNEAAAQTARDAGLDVRTGMLDSHIAGLPPGGFDVILMKYALEHVHSPRETLSQAARLLRAGGTAVFWIPNFASLDARLFGAAWRGLDAPRHLYIFTPKTISAYAQAVGLRVAAISYSGVPNDWAGSVEFALKPRAAKLTALFGVGNPLMLAAWLPVSAAAAALRRAGRMRVTLTH